MSEYKYKITETSGDMVRVIETDDLAFAGSYILDEDVPCDIYIDHEILNKDVIDGYKKWIEYSRVKDIMNNVRDGMEDATFKVDADGKITVKVAGHTISGY